MGKGIKTTQQRKRVVDGLQNTGVITDSGISRISVGEKQSVFLRLSEKDQRFGKDELTKLRTGGHIPLVDRSGIE